MNSIFFSFELNKFINISDQDMGRWGKLYPSVDIENELQHITQWVVENKYKAKTKKAWRKFITDRLQRAYEKITEQSAQIYKNKYNSVKKSNPIMNL